MKCRLRRIVCRLSFSLAGHGAAGKEPSVGSCSDVPARKSKMMAAHFLFGCVDASIVALTSASTKPVSGLFVAILR